MSVLREKLRQYTASTHQRLEALASMQEYATGAGSMARYHSTLNALRTFWSSNPPVSSALPHRFHAFRSGYIDALLYDCRTVDKAGWTDSVDTVVLRNELALFYVLTGSSLGAKLMLKRQQGSGKPQRHLQVLAEQGGDLWREFLKDQLPRALPEHEEEILHESQNIFEMLYQQICCAG